ncbi:MAG: hypothetical protein ACOYN0_12470 [Phycisphaerales bacterium]
MVVFLLVMPTVLVVWGVALAWRAGVALWERRAAERSVQPRRRQPTRMPRVKSAAGIGLCVLVAVTSFLYGMFSVERSNDLLALWRALDVWMLTGAGIALVGLGIAVAGMTLDPAYGRRRCAGCWYEFIMLASDATCPECGRKAKGERDLLRTRGSRGMVWLGLGMVAMSYAPVGLSNVRAMGVRGMFPTTVLIAAYGWVPDEWIGATGGQGLKAVPGGLVSRVFSRSPPWRWQLNWYQEKVAARFAAADSIAEANRLLGQAYTWSETGFPAHLVDDAVRDLSLGGVEANEAAMFLQMMARLSDPAAAEAALKHASELRRALSQPGRAGVAAAGVLVWLDANREVVAAAIMDEIARRPRGVVRTQLLTTLGPLAVRDPGAREIVMGWSASSDQKVREDAVEVLTGMWSAQGGDAQGEVLTVLARLVRDQNVAVSDLAISLGFAYGYAWQEPVSVAAEEEIIGREVGRSGLMPIYDRVGVQRAVWFIVDESDPSRAGDATLAAVLARSRTMADWRSWVEEALSRESIPERQRAALQGELQRLDAAARQKHPE